MLVTCLADTHELHRQVRVPDGDLLIFAGDITFFSERPSVIEDFNDWLGELPHRHKLVVPGNHDKVLLQKSYRDRITNAHLLINEGIEIEGMKIWGSPVTPYADTAFGIATAEERKQHWAKIPPNLDVLITHGPPYEILDREPRSKVHQGDPQLLEAVKRSAPSMHVFGHIHGANGAQEIGGALFLNCALAGPHGQLAHSPFNVLMERERPV